MHIKKENYLQKIAKKAPVKISINGYLKEIFAFTRNTFEF